MMQMMSITKETLENEYGSALPEFTVSDLMKHISSEQIKKVISRTSPICSTFSFLAEKDGKTYAISAYIMTPFALQTHDDISRFIKEHGAEKLDIKEEYDEGRGLVYSWGEKGNDIYIYFNLIPMNIYEKQKS